MTIRFSSLGRAILLLAAIVLVGGAGCLAMTAAGNAQRQRDARRQDETRERRIAQLAPQAQAGDPQAMLALAFALMAVREPGDKRTAPFQAAQALRIVELLDAAAQKGNLEALAVLGDMLGAGQLPAGTGDRLPDGMKDPPRAIALLKRAATGACVIHVHGDPESRTYSRPTDYLVPPAGIVTGLLRGEQQADDARLWRARSVMHCDRRGAYVYEREVMRSDALPVHKSENMVLLLLTGDRERIARAAATLPPEAMAASEREAAALRRRVAESERDYPAPPPNERQ